MLRRLKIAHLPTAIEDLPRLSEVLGGPKIYVKRDDQTGLAFGGNKTRKLEYLLADAKGKGARTLITAGAVQSNHCRQTAAAANRAGFNCILVLTGDIPANPTGNNFLDHLLGAEIVWAGQSDREQSLAAAFDNSIQAGQNPYLIPYGGSNEIGAAAFAYALKEMIDQEPEFDWVIFPSSSGGTQAGLAAGKRIFGFKGKVLGISIDNPANELKEKVAGLATETRLALGNEEEFSADQILVNDDFLGGGYGIMGEPELEALNLFAKNEGLLLDPVYTGRAAAGLIELIRRGDITADQKVLFWHTGGTPALFAQPYLNILLTGEIPV